MPWKFLGMENPSVGITTGYPEIRYAEDCVLATHMKGDMQLRRMKYSSSTMLCTTKPNLDFIMHPPAYLDYYTKKIL